MSFCGLIKGIISKTGMLCFVLMNSVLLNFFRVWLLYAANVLGVKESQCAGTYHYHLPTYMCAYMLVLIICPGRKGLARFVKRPGKTGKS